MLDSFLRLLRNAADYKLYIYLTAYITPLECEMFRNCLVPQFFQLAHSHVHQITRRPTRI